MPVPEEGQTDTFTRRFTTEDVRRFTAVSADAGEHHEEPDEGGRLLVHGLLTATLPTKVGGDYDVLAETMAFEFPRPVYTGEEVTCEVTFHTVEEREHGHRVDARGVCRNEAGDVVLRVEFGGRIRR
ncbi:dehydratase [Haloarchaeobius sp. HRN-SO-5]|uniref:dehydratase n=1 Tax=Haloarchaeobius sp. HRN-SO-5 TaxID=3446118 RepID=UPI003EBA1A59